MASNHDRPHTEPACVNNHMLHHFDYPTGGSQVASTVVSSLYAVRGSRAIAHETLRLGAPAGARRIVAVL
jgi:hypothetical protein